MMDLSDLIRYCGYAITAIGLVMMAYAFVKQTQANYLKDRASGEDDQEAVTKADKLWTDLEKLFVLGLVLTAVGFAITTIPL